MPDENDTGQACIHACAWGCGRKYDVIIVQIIDGSTLMLCIPCMTSFSVNVMKAMVEPESPEVQEVLGSTDLTGVMLVTESGSDAPTRGFSDPAPADDEFSFDGM